MADERQNNLRYASDPPVDRWSGALETHKWAGALAIAALVLLVYYPALRGGVLLDDDQLLTENDLVKAPDGLRRIWSTTESRDYYPLVYSSFWLEWRLWNSNLTGFHLVNAAWHVVSALLIWRILRKLSLPGAFLAALLFAVHPVNVESVAWIVQRRNLMALALALLSTWAYLQADSRNAAADKTGNSWAALCWYAFSILSFALAMLSKASVAIFPVVLLLIVWWQRRRITGWDVAKSAPLFLIALALTLVNLWFQTHGADVVIRHADLAERLTGAGMVVWFYLSKALLPIDLVFVYSLWKIDVGSWLWWVPLAGALGVTLLLAQQALLRGGNWARALWFAWLLFCVALAPALGLVDVGFMRYSLVADHYLHCGIIAVAALAAAAWSVWRRQSLGTSRGLANLGAVGVVGALALLSWRQSRLYDNAIDLYQDTVAKNPTSSMAHFNLGIELNRIGEIPQALEHYRKAVALKPDDYLAHNNFGSALAHQGRAVEAIQQFHLALILKPEFAEAHYNLGMALADSGQLQEAMDEYQLALAVRPAYVEARDSLGIALAMTGRIQEAIAQFQMVLEQRPDQWKARNNLGMALVRVGKLQEAIEQFEQVVRLKPDYAQVYANLAQAYADAGRGDEARSTAQKALELARAQGLTALARRLEGWLADVPPSNAHKVPPPAATVPPSPQRSE